MLAAPGGTLGAGRVASADADGYTLLLHHIGMATSATLYRKLAYDTLNAFEYVGLRHRRADDHRFPQGPGPPPTSRA